MTAKRSVVLGCGSYLPQKVLTTAELAARPDTSDDWIVQRTGIRQRHIAAEGEFQASKKLADAAKVLSQQPSAITLRYLQTLREIATENNSTTIFPIPIDLLKPFLTKSKRG